MYSKIFFEISGKCNASCYWCKTGYSNLNKESSGGFVDLDKFSEAINFLIKKNILTKQNYLSLYNWGEPLLHPHFKDIVRFLNKNEISYSLSSNASKLIEFDNSNDLSYLRSIKFSMSGFSNDSYKKGHGFSFEKIKNNIKQMNSNFKACGFRGRPSIYYHVYQYNFHEMPNAITFAKNNKMKFNATYSFLNDFDRYMQYINNELPYPAMKRASKELFLYYIDDLDFINIPNQNSFYQCPQSKFLHIDENCDIILCCGISQSFGKLFDISFDNIQNLRANSDYCRKCLSYSLPFIIKHRPSPP